MNDLKWTKHCCSWVQWCFLVFNWSYYSSQMWHIMLPHHSQISHHIFSWHQQKALLHVTLVVKNQRKVQTWYNCWTCWKTLFVLLVDHTAVTISWKYKRQVTGKWVEMQCNLNRRDFHCPAVPLITARSLSSVAMQIFILCCWGIAVCSLRLAALTENRLLAPLCYFKSCNFTFHQDANYQAISFHSEENRTISCLPFWNFAEVIHQRKLSFHEREKRTGAHSSLK